MYHISSVKNFLSCKSLVKLYYALVHPHILYCLAAYSFTSAKNRKTIFNKQKQIVRIICKAKYNAHSEPLFYNAKILPLEDLITQQKLMFMHSIAHNYCPVNFPFFNFNMDMNNHRFDLRNDNDFYVQRATSTFVQNMPLISFPSSWNNLDQNYKSITSKLLFKKSLKSELLDKYSNFRCDRTLCISCIGSY